jgi:hypothetical protein
LEGVISRRDSLLPYYKLSPFKKLPVEIISGDKPRYAVCSLVVLRGLASAVSQTRDAGNKNAPDTTKGFAGLQSPA